MKQNAVQQKENVEFLLDRTGSPRFGYELVFRAINMAIEMIVKDRIDNMKRQKDYSFERSQVILDELDALVIESTPIVPVNDVVEKPDDYRHLVRLDCKIDGTYQTARPVTHAAKVGRDPFRKPNDTTRVLRTQNAEGFVVQYDKGNFVDAKMIYIKEPNQVSIGDIFIKEDGVLVIGQEYVVIDPVTHNGIYYPVGISFVATVNSITEGTVVLKSFLVNCELSGVVHDEINRMAAAILNGTIEDYMKKKNLEVDIEKQ